MDEKQLGGLLAGLVEGVHAYARGEDVNLVAAFARVQTERAERLEQAHRSALQHLGDDHPAVARLGASAETARRYRVHAQDLVEQAEAAPRVRAHELVVSGEVVDAQRRPLHGVRVRLFDRDVREDDLLGDEWTDAKGRFHMVFHERDYYEPGEGEPELYVVIDTADGVRIANTRSQAVPESGVPSFLRVELSRVAADEVSRPGAVTAGQCTGMTTKGTRCKRPATTGSIRCKLHASS